MRKKTIKAYHQVGGDSMEPSAREALLNQVLGLGEIIPAIQRVQRMEMTNECFTDESQDITIRGRFPEANPETISALSIIAHEKINQLPEVGTTHTLFNCLDLIVGDFESIFMSIGNWYAVDNGFVFDAEELLMGGAYFRPRDLLGIYNDAIQRVGKVSYRSKSKSPFKAYNDAIDRARVAIEVAINRVHEEFEFTGKRGVFELRECMADGKCPGEIVWPGSLPLGLAIEMWREGRRTTFKEGVRR